MIHLEPISCHAARCRPSIRPTLPGLSLKRPYNIIIIIIVSNFCPLTKLRTADITTAVINDIHKNSLNKNVFKSFFTCCCVCAWRMEVDSKNARSLNHDLQLSLHNLPWNYFRPKLASLVLMLRVFLVHTFQHYMKFC